MLLVISSCSSPPVEPIKRHNIGLVSYGLSDLSAQNYAALKEYLGTQLNSVIELEPTYNEVRALQQLKSNRWDIVFAPPGLAAIAISRFNYQPIISLEGNDSSRSVIVVKQDSSFEDRPDLANQKIILGQKGSATGYYLPLYNLYGVNLTEIIYSPTPKEVLQWLDEGKAAAGALSLAEYNLYRREFSPNSFRILHLDNHPIPAGSVLLSDRIERNQEAIIVNQFQQTPSHISASAGFLPSAEVPNYDYLVKVIERVQEITTSNPVKN